MNNPLYLFVGPSGSGKSTIADLFDKKFGYKQVWSYCTRKPRYDNEPWHTFITEDEFDELENIVAYTEYNNFRYGTTADQLDKCSIYVVDIPGVETLLRNYNTKRPIVIFYFESTVATRIDRMLERGDSDTAIVGRLHNDEAFDWMRQLDHLVWYYSNIKNKDVDIHVINANESKTNVVALVGYYINMWEDD